MVRIGKYSGIPDDLNCDNCNSPGTMELQPNIEETGNRIICTYKCIRCGNKTVESYDKHRYRVY